MGYEGFETLEVWKRARELKNELAELVRTFPEKEKFLLADQLLRSSRSVTAMIAEGHGRRTWQEKLRYCIMARGSLSETVNHLIDALDEKYIAEEKLAYFRKKISEVEKLLNGYIKYLGSRTSTS